VCSSDLALIIQIIFHEERKQWGSDSILTQTLLYFQATDYYCGALTLIFRPPKFTEDLRLQSTKKSRTMAFAIGASIDWLRQDVPELKYLIK
jgi:hypothetical protein